MPNKQMRRVNVGLIRAESLKHGWDDNGLALNAGVDRKTVATALVKQEPISIAKIAKIAKRLGLEPRAIILPDEQAGNVFTPGVVGQTSTDAKTLQPAPTPKQNSVRLALQADGFDINVRFAAIPDQARLKQQAISLMASLVSDLNLQDGYDPDDLDATPGSVIVTVKLSARDAATLLFAFMAGKLTDSKVESITINDRRKLAASPLAAKGDGEGAEKQQAASALGRVESQGRATERPTTGDLSARIQSVLSELTEDERAAIYSRVYGAKAPESREQDSTGTQWLARALREALEASLAQRTE